MTDNASSFKPISPNPFIVGNPVRGRTMFFGRAAEFELVRKRFTESDHGGLLVFCGERRSGKTSILFQILDRRLGPDFIPVLIDMQSMAVGDEIDFLTRISDGVVEALGPDAADVPRPEFLQSSSHSATFQKFIQGVLRIHPDKKLILLFDEYELFENKIDSGQLSEDVLHILGSLMENHRVFLIFTGSQHLEQRRRDYWKILGKSIYKTISFLERSDALHLIRKPVEGRVHYKGDIVESIYRLTAGQAFYTQAVCQGLVDHLNEERTHDATPESLAVVVDGMVNNALPQMIFHWDGLERDEKLVLSLLAESLPDEGSFAKLSDVLKLLRDRDYPLELERAGIATALEKLFKTDLLLRHDEGSEPAYAFRMDLWRLWIRRMHSVWQVMREEGLEIRAGGQSRKRRRVIGLAAAGGIAIAIVAVLLTQFNRGGNSGGTAGGVVAAGPVAPFALEATPEDALIFLDDRRVGMGTYVNTIPADHDHPFRIQAAGYADSEFVVRVAAGDSLNSKVALRALLGDLRVETEPSGARITVNGRPVGTSPAIVRGLQIVDPVSVEASAQGFGAARRQVTLSADNLTSTRLVLEVGRTNVLVTSEPTGSSITFDGGRSGTAPWQLENISIGSHSFSASLEGFVAAETTLTVTANTRRVHLDLAAEPKGVLVVLGDRPAAIYIDNVLIKQNVPNSGPQSLGSGDHLVRVILVSGESIDKTVRVVSRERAIYDYSRGTVTRRPEDGS